MNIFLLSWNLLECALYYCDQHVVKIILELAQMLYACQYLVAAPGVEPGKTNTAWRAKAPKKDAADAEGGYAMGYHKHPITLWLAADRANYVFGCQLAEALLKEYAKRYGVDGKTHASAPHIAWLTANIPPFNATRSSAAPTKPHPLAMPEHCKVDPSDPVRCYRLYYILHKKRFARYKKGVDMPDWLRDEHELKALPNADRARIIAARDAAWALDDAKEQKAAARKQLKRQQTAADAVGDEDAPPAAKPKRKAATTTTKAKEPAAVSAADAAAVAVVGARKRRTATVATAVGTEAVDTASTTSSMLTASTSTSTSSAAATAAPKRRAATTNSKPLKKSTPTATTTVASRPAAAQPRRRYTTSAAAPLLSWTSSSLRAAALASSSAAADDAAASTAALRRPISRPLLNFAARRTRVATNAVTNSLRFLLSRRAR